MTFLIFNLQFFDKSDQSEIYLNEDGNANSVLFIPAFTGLGAPYWNSDVRGQITGITRDTSDGTLYLKDLNTFWPLTLISS